MLTAKPDHRVPEGDEGFTLIEMIVAMSIFSVILAIFASAITDWTKDVVRTSRVSDQTSTGRIVFNLLDKQVPSALAVNRPVLVGADWYVEMETDATTPNTCTQWRMGTVSHLLQWRTWPTNTGTVAATPAWRTVDQYAVLSKDPTTGLTIPPFVLDVPDGTYATQRLTVNVSEKRSTGPVTQTRATFAVRNSSSSTTTNLDANGDGVSDTQICQDIAGARS
jgi:prepilin-type N-terminal cleavage/methylation domain-containing protein